MTQCLCNRSITPELGPSTGSGEKKRQNREGKDKNLFFIRIFFAPKKKMRWMTKAARSGGGGGGGAGVKGILREKEEGGGCHGFMWSSSSVQGKEGKAF